MIKARPTFHFIIMKRSATRQDGAWLYIDALSMHYVGTNTEKLKFCDGHSTVNPEAAGDSGAPKFQVHLFNSNLNLCLILPTNRLKKFTSMPLIIDYKNQT